MIWNDAIQKRLDMGQQEFASFVIQSHQAYLDTYRPTFLACAENYAFLFGRQNYKYDSKSNQIREDRYAPALAQALPEYCFDRIQEAERRLLAQAVNAFPEIESVVRTENLTPDPEKIRKAKINDKLLGYFRENKWNLSQLVTLHLFPHAYCGGVAYLMPMLKRTGTTFQAYKDGQATFSIKAADGTEQSLSYNDDGTLDIGGHTTDPATVGIEVKREPVEEPQFEVVPCFNVSIRGRIYQSMSECLDCTHRVVKTLGEIKAMFPDSVKEIEALAASVPAQDTPPEDTSETYLRQAGFPMVKWGKLVGDNRMVVVYQTYCPPNGLWLDGYTSTVLQMTGGTTDTGGAIVVDFVPELPGHSKAQVGFIPLFRFPLSELLINSHIPQSPMEKAKDAQRAYNRIGNALLSNAAYNATPPLWIPQGMEFSSDNANWGDLNKYPLPADKNSYSPSPTNPQAKPEFAAMPMSPAVSIGVDFLKEALMSVLGVRYGVEGPMPVDRSGKALQIQVTMDRQGLIPALRIWERSAYDAIKAAMRLAQTTYKAGQKFPIPNENGATIIEWSDDIWDDSFDYKMRSKLDEPLTKAAKLQNIGAMVGMIAQIKQLGLEEQYPIEKIMALQDVGEFTTPADPNIDKAEWENEMLASDQEIKEPLTQEPHALHARIHKDWITSKEFLQYGPEIQARAIKHLDITLAKMRALQRADQLMNPPQVPGQPPTPQQPAPAEQTAEPIQGVV